MATRMTINGVSTCTEAGTEKYERFQSGIGRRKRTLVQYDYRHPIDRELFSCVKPTLDECRAARDKWLNAKKGKEADYEHDLSNADSQVQRTYHGIGRYL